MWGSFFVAEFNAIGIPTYTSEYIPPAHGNVNRNDNVIFKHSPLQNYAVMLFLIIDA